MTKFSYEQITKTAETDHGMNLSQKVRFHYFNPNGANALKKQGDNAISQAVNAGAMKPGAHLAYGSFNDYFGKRLGDLLDVKRLNRHTTNSIIELLEQDARKAIKKAAAAMGVQQTKESA